MPSDELSIRQLQLATQYMTFGFGFPVLFIGLFGNILNLIVFISLSNYKKNASSFSMLSKSIFDLNALILGLIGHILIQGFRTNAITSVEWCRFRIPLLYINSLCSFTCLCFQSIDCYLSSSRDFHIRQLSHIRTARYSLLIFIFIWICNESPYYFFPQSTVIPNWRCQTTNTVYAQYRTYFTILSCSIILPTFIMSLFGYLTYRNLHVLDIDQRYRLPNLTRQTIRMVLYEISIVLLFEFPFGICQIYLITTANVVKDTYRQTQEQFVNVFFFIYAYNANAIPFYCYCAASKPFRKQVMEVFRGSICNKRRNNVIVPSNQSDRIVM